MLDDKRKRHANIMFVRTTRVRLRLREWNRGRERERAIFFWLGWGGSKRSIENIRWKNASLSFIPLALRSLSLVHSSDSLTIDKTSLTKYTWMDLPPCMNRFLLSCCVASCTFHTAIAYIIKVCVVCVCVYDRHTVSCRCCFSFILFPLKIFFSPSFYECCVIIIFRSCILLANFDRSALLTQRLLQKFNSLSLGLGIIISWELNGCHFCSCILERFRSNTHTQKKRRIEHVDCRIALAHSMFKLTVDSVFIERKITKTNEIFCIWELRVVNKNCWEKRSKRRVQLHSQYLAEFWLFLTKMSRKCSAITKTYTKIS